MRPGQQIAGRDAAGLEEAIGRTAAWLLGRQQEKGYWWEEARADASLEADYVLLQLWLQPPVGEEWEPQAREQIGRAVESIRRRQLDGGGYPAYPGGPADASVSVKAYWAMKLWGVDVGGEEMTRLRERILALGGLQAANTYVKIHLSLFGLYPREHVPEIPPEMILAGKLLYKMSAWARTIFVPLSIVQALAGVRPGPRGFGLGELHAPGEPFGLRVGESGWGRIFAWLDKAAKLWEAYAPGEVRHYAIRRCREWIRERAAHADGLGAHQPAMLYTVMALECMGELETEPERREAEQQFLNLMADDGERFFFQPLLSPVWDTAAAAYALGEAGYGERPEMARGAEWLLGKESRRAGDWSVRRPGVTPSGWYSAFRNEHYPDLAVTGMALLGLLHARGRDEAARKAAAERAMGWVKAMQSKDGGWAAFDADCNGGALGRWPFAGSEATQDRSCADITGRMLEALARHGAPREDAAVRRAVDYLVRTQEDDGSWSGRWGVNYIYGTSLAARGLQAAGEGDREVHMLRAAEWLRGIQNADGGWGESCESYERGTYVGQESTPSQTAWAILGLLAAGDLRSGSAERGVEFLLRTQMADGTWEEDRATGTGLPGVLHLSYSLYRNVYPLLALAEFRKAAGGEE